MHGLNRIQLIGNVGNDPDLQYTPGGTALLKLRLAVNERRKIRDEWTDVTEWFTVVVWHKRAEALAKLISKGAPVMAEGPMRRRTYEDKSGAQRDVYEVSADNVILLGSGRGSQRQERTQEPQRDALDEDDIPF